MNRLFCVAVFGVSTLLAACSLFTPAANNVTVYRKVTLDSGADAPTSIVLDAYERVILSKTKVPYRLDGNPASAPSGSIGAYTVNCAEPSPDVFGATAVAQQISAEAKKSGTELSASGALASAIAQNGSQLNRAQTIQLLRDKMFNACLAYADGALTPLQYHRMLNATAEASVVLSAVDGLLPAAVPPQNTVQAQAPQLAAKVPDAGASATKTSAPASAPAASDAASATKATFRATTPRAARLQTVAFNEQSIPDSGALVHVADAAQAASAPKVKAKPKPAKAATKAASSADASASAPAPQKVTADVESIVAVQYIVSRYMVSSFVHDCIDYYTAVASLKAANASGHPVTSDAAPTSEQQAQLILGDAEPGMNVFCGSLFKDMLALPPAATGKPNSSSTSPVGNPGQDQQTNTINKPENVGTGQPMSNQTRVVTAAPTANPIILTPIPATASSADMSLLLKLGAPLYFASPAPQGAASATAEAIKK